MYKIEILLWLLLVTTADAAVVTVNAPSNVRPGQSFDVNITINPEGADIAGAQTNIRLDPPIFKVNRVVEGSTLFQNNGQLSTFFNNGTINSSQSTIKNIYSAIIGPHNVSATGTFIVVNMTTEVGSSRITLTNVKVSDPNGNYVPVSVANKTVMSYYCDVNSDGPCNFADVVIIGQNYNPLSNAACPQCSLDGDADVDSFDIRISVLSMEN